jgi:membrane-bound lytic murein transglycosylase D
MIRAWFRRLAPWEPTLRRILREVGVPEDLLFVALAESGFNPTVRSSVGAAGMWQFMEPTGRIYGLRQDFWLDERHDVQKSTWAAALYLKDLHTRFGSWELALAAYNAGYGLVLTAVERFNTNNFWALVELENGLPYATTNYPPKIVAAALVGRNRSVFGVDAAALGAQAPHDPVEVQVPHTTSLQIVAEWLGEDAATLRELNAGYIRGRTPARLGSAPLEIPRRSLPAWERSRARLESLWQKETTWTVREGESLARIARASGITEKELRTRNGIRDAAEVGRGITLVVPTRESSAEQRPRPTAEPPALAAVPPLSPEAGTKRVFVATTRATTPGSLSQALGVPWSRVVAWNDLDPEARLQAGQVLQALVPESFDGDAAGVALLGPTDIELVERGSREHLEAELRRRGKHRRGYQVRRGDTLARIARRFELSVGDLSRINGFSSAYEPQAGEILVVYVDAARLRSTDAAPPPKGLVSDAKGTTAPTTRPPTTRPPTTRPPTTAETARVPGSLP